MVFRSEALYHHFTPNIPSPSRPAVTPLAPDIHPELVARIKRVNQVSQHLQATFADSLSTHWPSEFTVPLDPQNQLLEEARFPLYCLGRLKSQAEVIEALRLSDTHLFNEDHLPHQTTILLADSHIRLSFSDTAIKVTKIEGQHPRVQKLAPATILSVAAEADPYAQSSHIRCLTYNDTDNNSTDLYHYSVRELFEVCHAHGYETQLTTLDNGWVVFTANHSDVSLTLYKSETDSNQIPWHVYANFTPEQQRDRRLKQRLNPKNIYRDLVTKTDLTAGCPQPFDILQFPLHIEAVDNLPTWLWVDREGFVQFAQTVGRYTGQYSSRSQNITLHSKDEAGHSCFSVLWEAQAGEGKLHIQLTQKQMEQIKNERQSLVYDHLENYLNSAQNPTPEAPKCPAVIDFNNPQRFPATTMNLQKTYGLSEYEARRRTDLLIKMYLPEDVRNAAFHKKLPQPITIKQGDRYWRVTPRPRKTGCIESWVCKAETANIEPPTSPVPQPADISELIRHLRQSKTEQPSQSPSTVTGPEFTQAVEALVANRQLIPGRLTQLPPLLPDRAKNEPINCQFTSLTELQGYMASLYSKEAITELSEPEAKTYLGDKVVSPNGYSIIRTTDTVLRITTDSGEIWAWQEPNLPHVSLFYLQGSQVATASATTIH